MGKRKVKGNLIALMREDFSDDFWTVDELKRSPDQKLRRRVPRGGETIGFWPWVADNGGAKPPGGQDFDPFELTISAQR